MYQPFLFLPMGNRNKLPCVAYISLVIANQIIDVLNHEPVCLDDDAAAGNAFQSRWVVCSVKALRWFDRPFGGMVSYEQTKDNIGIFLLCIDKRVLHHPVKGSVLTNNELSYSVFSNVPLYSSRSRISGGAV